MHAGKLDAIDLKILEMLQMEGRIKRSELAKAVNMSIPSISDRLRKMEAEGIIKGYRGVLTPTKIGLGVTAFIFITISSSEHYDEIITLAREEDEILEFHAITGQATHLMKVRTTDTIALEVLLSKIQTWPGLKNTLTNIALSSPKEDIKLSLKHFDF